MDNLIPFPKKEEPKSEFEEMHVFLESVLDSAEKILDEMEVGVQNGLITADQAKQIRRGVLGGLLNSMIRVDA